MELIEGRKSEFYKQTNYLSEIPFLFDNDIYEYDIKQANIHALHAAGRITLTEFTYYERLPKQTREVAIGNMIKEDPSLYHTIQDIIGEAKYKFATINGLEESQILRIANDSLYVLNPYKDLLWVIEKNGVPLKFVCKNHFKNYMRLTKKVLFFCNTEGEYWNIDIKGINSSKLEKHQELLSRICNIIDARVNGDKDTSLRVFNNLYEDYINLRLPLSCYRELNSDSSYRLKGESVYLINELNPYGFDLNNLDINYNLSILRTIYSYLIQS